MSRLLNFTFSDIQNKAVPWMDKEVQTFLCSMANDTVQREPDGETHNEKVFQKSSKVSELMAENFCF